MKEMEMRSRSVPRAEWATFLEGFSRRHRDWLATVEVLGRQGAQVEARELPLQGLTCEPDGRSITILFGRRSEDHLEHPVEDPQQVWVEVAEDGAEAALEIESGNGTKTILEFRSVAPPEAVDGLAEL